MSLNILIVDDSDVIRAMISRTLQLADVPVQTVFEASNGREALDVLSESWVDLVLADINMPIMDGAEMVSRMREEPETADIPVIVVSTEGAVERVESIMSRGVAAWVRKPFTPEEIRDAITAVLDRPAPNSHRTPRLAEVFRFVVEQFAFASPEPAEEPAAPPAEDVLVEARIAFSGAASGVLAIAAPLSLCTDLTANVLAVAPTDPSAIGRAPDTLAELANMACGHLATELEPTSSTELRPPTVSRIEREEWQRREKDPRTIPFLIDGEPLLLWTSVLTQPVR